MSFLACQHAALSGHAIMNNHVILSDSEGSSIKQLLGFFALIFQDSSFHFATLKMTETYHLEG